MHRVKIHAPYSLNFKNPFLHLWYPGHNEAYQDYPVTDWDDYGAVFEFKQIRNYFCFKFGEKNGSQVTWEEQERCYGQHLGPEVWTVSHYNEVYPQKPAVVAGSVRDLFPEIAPLVRKNQYLPETDVRGEGVVAMLGATYLQDGTTLFGFYHPRAARVYLVGNFNNWQSPYHERPEPELFLPMQLYLGYKNEPNLWLLRTELPDPTDPEKNAYQYLVVGGVPLNEKQQPVKLAQDPYARRYGTDYNRNDCLVIDPSAYQWHDQDWVTPPVDRLILYEFNVYGFTDQDPDLPAELAGTFRGTIHRIKEGYFEDLGITALALMPTSEAPTALSDNRLGYDPSGFMTIERDFGTCDEFRALVDTAHQHGLAVIVDQVFNHTSNYFNPLWQLIQDGTPGGFYFSGSTPWGNRVATEKEEVQNMLIDACKMFIREYHVDGFRFDATHSSWMDHTFLHRLAYEIKDKGFKPDCILIAENLPNEVDLNLQGYNGYAQWCDAFHDKIKALLREGVFRDWIDDSTTYLGSIFYFSKDFYAAHTNNVINYCESHDENSVPYEVATRGDGLIWEPAKERKSRLGLFATMVALGQPMIYMGQEFGVERPRNRIDLDWPEFLEKNHYYQWSSGLIRLRRRYPGLRIYGYDPCQEGAFAWLLGPWLGEKYGQGKKVIGWTTNPGPEPWERMVVLLNFEPYEVMVDLEFPLPGYWVKLADIDRVNDLPPAGENSIDLPTTIKTTGHFGGFTLPSSSGFIYKWESGL
jgi:1,4-alpha-glucan branching enzyme